MTKSITGHTVLLLWISLQTPKPHFQVTSEVFKVLQSQSCRPACTSTVCSLCETSDQNLCWWLLRWNIATDRRQSLIWIIPDVSWENGQSYSKVLLSNYIQLIYLNYTPLLWWPVCRRQSHFISYSSGQKANTKQRPSLLQVQMVVTQSLHRFLYKCLLMHSAYRPDRNPAGSVIGAITFSLRLTTSKL